MASYRLTWPPTTLLQCGVLASSMSASQTRAPELRALIVIFRSVGPVISTRRSWRSSGTGATVQSPAGAGDLLAAHSAGGQELVTAGPEPSLQLRDEVEGLGGEDLGSSLDLATGDLNVHELHPSRATVSFEWISLSALRILIRPDKG